MTPVDKLTLVSEITLRELLDVAKAADAYFTEHDLDGLSPEYFKSYHAVKDALKKLRGGE